MPTREERLSEAIARQSEALASGNASPLTSVGGSPAARTDVETVEGAGGSAAAHEPAQLNPDDPFDRGMIAIHPTTRLLQANGRIPGDLDPDREGRLSIASRESGLPRAFVDLELSAVENFLRGRGVDAPKLMAEQPVLAEWLSEPENFRLAFDDTVALSGFGDAITRGAWLSFVRGLAQVGVGAARAVESETGAEDFLGIAARFASSGQLRFPDQGYLPFRDFVTGLEDNILPRTLQFDSDWVVTQLAADAWMGFAGIVPFMAGAAGSAAVGGAVGGAIAGAAGATTTGGPGIVAAAPGVIPGAIGGAFAFSATVMKGLSYSELIRMVDEDGNHIPREIARDVSRSVGIATGALEIIPLNRAWRLFGGQRVLGRIMGDVAAKHLVKRSVRRSWGEFMKDYALAIGTEAPIEGLQTIVEEYGKNLAIGMSDMPNSEMATWHQIQAAALDATWQAGLAMAAGGPFLSGPRLFYDLRAHRAAKYTQSVLREMVEPSKNSRLKKRDRVKLREVVKRMTEGKTSPTHFWIDVGAWTRYWAGQGRDAAEAAKELMGTDEAYLRAQQQGGDFAIPIEVAADALVETEHFEALMPDMRLHQGEMSMRDSAALQKEMDFLKESSRDIDVDEFEDSTRQVYDEMLGRITAVSEAANIDEQQAVDNARMYAHVVGRFAERLGITTMQMHRQYQLGIRMRPETPNSAAQVNPIIQELRAEATRGQFGLQLDLTPADTLAQRLSGDTPGPVLGLRLETMPQDLDERVKRLPLRDEWLAEAKATLKSVETVDERAQATAGHIWGDGGELREYLRFLARRLGGEAGVLRALDEAGLRVDGLETATETLEPDQGAAATRDAAVEHFGDDESVTQYQDRKDSGQLGVGDTSSITFKPGGRQFSIDLINSDPTTIFHETAHFYLEVLGDLVESKKAPEELSRDYSRILKFLRVKARSEIGRKQHERFALAFETYLKTGRAPHTSLRGAFARIRRFMIALYGKTRDLVKLTPEIQGVFDRMIASEEHIRQAHAQYRMEAVPEIMALLSEEGKADYRKRSQESIDEGEDNLRRRLLEDLGDLDKFAEESKERIRADVEAELAQREEMVALRFLQNGDLHRPIQPEARADPDIPEALKNESGRPAKLSRPIVRKRFGDDVVNALPDDVFHERVGIDPDHLAIHLGFDTGEQMVMALRGQRDYDDIVDDETDRRVTREFDSIMGNNPLIAQEAAAAAANSSLIEKLMIELRALRQEIKPGKDEQRRQPFDRAVMRDMAADDAQKQEVGQLKPHIFLRRSATHGDRAFKRMESGKLGEAYDEKLRQLWNVLLYRAHRDAKKQADSDRKFGQDMTKGAAQKRLAQASRTDQVVEGDPPQVDFVAAAQEILVAYGFRKQSPKKLKEAKRLRHWVQAMLDTDRDAVIPDDVIDRVDEKHYTELTVGRLHEVTNALRNINRIAALEVRMQVADGQMDLDQVVDLLVDSIETNLPLKPPPAASKFDRSLGEKMRLGVSTIDTALIRMEEVIDQADGRDIAGPWRQIIWEPIVKAQAASQDLQGKYTNRLTAMFDALPRAKRRDLARPVEIEGMGNTLTVQTMIVMVLNMGNVENFQRLRDGGLIHRGGLDPVILERVAQALTAEQLGLVNQIWELIDGLWPELEAQNRRLTGMAPKRVKPVPFNVTSVDGVEVHMTGGYFPIDYNPDSSPGGRQLNDVRENGVYRSNTIRGMHPAGWLIERLKNVNKPLNLDLHVVPQHLNAVIHDLTHREAVMQIHRILRDPGLHEKMQRRLGVAKTRLFMSWLQRVANDETTLRPRELGFVERTLSHIRVGTTIAALGFKVAPSTQNLANFGASMERITKGEKASDIAITAPIYFAGAFTRLVKDYARTKKFMDDRSGEIRNRFNNIDRDLRDAMRKQINPKLLPNMVRLYAFKLMQATDMLTVYPTWLAAHTWARDQGMSDSLATSHADRAIRTTLTAAGPKDMAQIQTGHEGMKALTMFYSWFSMKYSLYRALGHDIATARRDGHQKLVKWVPLVLARGMSVFLVEAWLSEIFSGRPPDPDDEKSFAEWAFWKTVFYPTMSLPFAREVTSGIERGLLGKRKFGVQLGPARFLEDVATVADDIQGLVGLKDKDVKTGEFLRHANRVLGTGLHYPSAQLEISFKYMMDVMQGEDDAKVWHALFRRQEGRK